MEGPDRVLWFAGDLADSWVVAIAGALPRTTLRLDCPDDLPETWPINRPTPEVLVLHRSVLNPTDAQRVARLKARADRTPRVVLCVGPHVRAAEVERWARLADVVLPEATASEVVLRHALRADRPARVNGRGGPRVVVVSSDFELRTTLAEVARLGGFEAEPRVEPVDLPPGVAVAWDVPVLEPGWPATLSGLTRSGPVVALMGFADRANVTLARDHGASACLDLPCDLDDLLTTLGRVTASRLDPPHDVPPTPKGKRSGLARRKN